MNEFPYVMPNFMPFTPNMPGASNSDIKKELDVINHELESIEKKLRELEAKIDEKTKISSGVDSGKGLYML